MQDFKKGDIVKLKSGGPKMVVEGFRMNIFNSTIDYEQVQCTWFNNDEKKTEFFDSNVIEVINE